MLLIPVLLAMLSLPTEPSSDAEIEADIRARLARSKIAVNGFQVKVRNGVATWTGTTSVVQHKGAATRMAKSAGAKEVVNRIEVSAEAKAKAAEKLRKNNRVPARTAPRTEQPREETEAAPAPPPVRRGVIKKLVWLRPAPRRREIQFAATAERSIPTHLPADAWDAPRNC